MTLSKITLCLKALCFLTHGIAKLSQMTFNRIIFSTATLCLTTLKVKTLGLIE
jgi:hypothetical protein